MSEQPKALRIAEWFEGGYGGCESEAAAELRRLYEENQKLLEALTPALENICAAKLCEFNSMSSRHEMIRLMDAAITAIREAMAHAPEVREQPVRPYRLLQDNGSKYFGASWDKAEQPAQQEPSVAAAWQQGYAQGVADERTSEANIGIAGFGAKVNPARNNPYSAEQPAQQDMPKLGCVNHDCDKCKARQQQELVEWLTGCPECGMDGGCDCSSGTWNPPASKQWVGLTNSDQLDLISAAKGIGGRIQGDGQLLALLVEHEAKLKEKNT